jgi:MFS family permease
MLIPMSAASYMTAAHLSFVLAGDGVTKPESQSIIMTASMLLNIAGSIYYPRLNARFGRRWVFVMILGSFAAGDLVIGLLPNAVGSTLGCWIIGIAGGLMTPFFVNVILDRTDASLHSRAVGLMYTMSYIGNFLNPFIITPLRGEIGNHPAFAVVGVLLAIAAGLQASTRRSPVGSD